MILVITNPVNSTVPIASEVFKKADCYDPNRSAFNIMCDILSSNIILSALDNFYTDNPIVLLQFLILSQFALDGIVYPVFSLIPKPSHVFQHIWEKLERPGWFWDVMFIYLPPFCHSLNSLAVQTYLPTQLVVIVNQLIIPKVNGCCQLHGQVSMHCC